MDCNVEALPECGHGVCSIGAMRRHLCKLNDMLQDQAMGLQEMYKHEHTSWGSQQNGPRGTVRINGDHKAFLRVSLSRKDSIGVTFNNTRMNSQREAGYAVIGSCSARRNWSLSANISQQVLCLYFPPVH